MENPITNTRFSTFPTAWVSGATLSKVLVANCQVIQSKIVLFKPLKSIASFRYKKKLGNVPDCKDDKTSLPRRDLKRIWLDQLWLWHH